MPELLQIYRYPMKSTQAELLDEAVLDSSGLQGDRRLALCDPEGELITGRNESKLIPLQSRLEEGFLVIKLNDQEHRFKLERGDEIDNKHFSYRFQSSLISKQADAWFTNYLGRPCHLIAQSQMQTRTIVEEFGNSELHMADAGPVLLLNRSSLKAMHQLKEEERQELRFRPNLVIESGKAFEEHEWDRIRIGNATLKRMKDCGRCVFTTKDPFTGERHPNAEPLRTLTQYRVNAKGEAVMGVYFIPESEAKIALSDPLEVLNIRAHNQ